MCRCSDGRATFAAKSLDFERQCRPLSRARQRHRNCSHGHSTCATTLFPSSWTEGHDKHPSTIAAALYRPF